MREKALKAHELAAARIEEANNACKGHDQWTLDLHGLHGTEAVSAVDRRYQSLLPCLMEHSAYLLAGCVTRHAPLCYAPSQWTELPPLNWVLRMLDAVCHCCEKARLQSTSSLKEEGLLHP